MRAQARLFPPFGRGGTEKLLNPIAVPWLMVLPGGRAKRLLVPAAVAAVLILGLAGLLRWPEPPVVIPPDNPSYPLYPTPPNYAPRPFQWAPPRSSEPQVPRDSSLDGILRAVLQSNNTDFRGPDGTIAPQYAPLLYWMAQMYPLSELAEASQEASLAALRLPESAPARKFLRWLDTDYRPAHVGCEDGTLPADCLVYYALYCDVLPAPSWLLPWARGLIQQGGYGRASAVIALSEMERRACVGSEARNALQKGLDIMANEPLVTDAQPATLPAKSLPGPTASATPAAASSVPLATQVVALLRAKARERVQPGWISTIEEQLKAADPAGQKSFPSELKPVAILQEAYAVLLWRQGA